MRGNALFVAVATVALAASAQAAATVLVESFEDGIGNVASNNTSLMTVSLNTSWGSEGTQSLTANHISGAPWALISLSAQQYNDLFASPDKKFYFDYKIENSLSTFASGKFVLQSAAGGWQEFGATQNYNRDGNVYTLTGDFSALAVPANAGGSWRKLGILVNGNGTYDMHIDNLRSTAVPEPTALLGMGVAGAGLLMRKRRTA